MSSSSSLHTTLDVVKYMKNKVPVFILSLHTVIFKYLYSSCEPLDEKSDIMIGYYIFVTLLCALWEFLYCYFSIKKGIQQTSPDLNRLAGRDTGSPVNGTNSVKLEKRDYVFCALSTVVSVLAFLSITFYMNINDAFNCFFSYDSIISSACLFGTFAIIATFSTLEKFCFQREIKIMARPADLENSAYDEL